MTLNQLRYFLALCEEKHFTRAARRCAVSQPSLTNAIRALENELGGALFFRKPRPQLTEIGRVLQPHFQLIVKAIDEAQEIAARVRQGVVRQQKDLNGRRQQPGSDGAVSGAKANAPEGPVR